jgi:glutaredoxin
MGLFGGRTGAGKCPMSDASYAGLSALNVVLYTRRGCHLCDQALETLKHHGLEPHCIDIDNDPAMRNKFDACVPVVEISGRVRFRGGVHPVLLKRIIRATRY